MKEYLENVNFEKNQQRTKKQAHKAFIIIFDLTMEFILFLYVFVLFFVVSSNYIYIMHAWTIQRIQIVVIEISVSAIDILKYFSVFGKLLLIPKQ